MTDKILTSELEHKRYKKQTYFKYCRICGRKYFPKTKFNFICSFCKSKKVVAMIFILVLLINPIFANKIIIDKGKQNIEYAKFAIKEFRKVEPFNSTRWIIVYSGKQNPGDLRIIIKDINGWGYGYGGTITISPKHLDSSFLLLHESYHALTNNGHTQDNSIMSKNGGNGKFTESQIKTIRGNL